MFAFVRTTFLASILWGEHGHVISGQAAAAALPATMPAFFRNAARQLAYLTPEPDRWRARDESALDPALDRAYSPEHFINLEQIPEHALDARDRYAYLDSLRAHNAPEPAAGLLPYRMLELTQRLRVEFRLWRTTKDPRTRLYIEQRIINDAGILGHYATDGANPHHTTIHHDGWVGDNPNGYTTGRGFHARFEAEYVGAKLKLTDVTPLVRRTPSVFRDLRSEIIAFLHRSHAELDRLYQLDKQAPFDSLTTSPEHRRFTAERLADGAEMLRDLWWTAWITSAEPVGTQPSRAP